MKELHEARQEVVDARMEVRQAQHIEMLVSSAFMAARQAVNASIDWFEQARAYRLLHMHLMHQSLRHVGDNDRMADVHGLLHCQLQAGGRPSSPSVDNPQLPSDLDNLLAQFDDTPVHDHHAKPFIQDGGDDDGYYE